MKRTFVKSMLTEGGGNEYSVKRMIGMLGFIVIVVTHFLCMGPVNKSNLSDPIIEAILVITVACITGVVAEKFSKYNQAQPGIQQTTETKTIITAEPSSTNQTQSNQNEQLIDP